MDSVCCVCVIFVVFLNKRGGIAPRLDFKLKILNYIFQYANTTHRNMHKRKQLKKEKNKKKEAFHSINKQTTKKKKKKKKKKTQSIIIIWNIYNDNHC